MKELPLELPGRGCRIAIAAGEFNHFIVQQLVDGALDALERKLDSRSLLEMLNRIEQLQGDVQRLRGDVELQTHRLEALQRQQREQYLDIDRRLQQLETGVAGGSAGSTAAMQGQLPQAACH